MRKIVAAATASWLLYRHRLDRLEFEKARLVTFVLAEVVGSNPPVHLYQSGKIWH